MTTKQASESLVATFYAYISYGNNVMFFKDFLY